MSGGDAGDRTIYDVGSSVSTGVGPAPVEVREMDLDDRGFAARYVNEAPLGQGGMGEVRLYRDARMGRAVAMKILRTFKDDPEVRARFLREAQIQAQLEHPAVVPVYDMGRNPEGVAFFTMKRVRGPTLARIIEQLRAGDADAARAYSQRRLLSAFSTICLALDHAHRRGVLHRDLKPDNLMLGDAGEVYLLDWGVATVREDLDGATSDTLSTSFEDQIHTQAGGISGTPGYIAPEVLEARGADVRSEVYSLGAILFEILALERLHQGSAQERLKSTLAGGEARPSVRAPTRDVAPELEALCVRATALDPDARPATVRELSDAIERHLDGDRDLELRRTLAREQTDRARDAAARAFAGSGDAAIADRRAALAAVGRALALDPDAAPARGLLLELMTRPPRDLPRDAERAWDEAEAADAHRAGRFATFAYLACVPLGLSPILWMGVRSWPVIGAGFGLILLAAFFALLLWRQPVYRMGIAFSMFLCSTAGLTLVSQTFGPFVLAPTLIATNTMAYLFHGRVPPWLTIGLAACAVLVPALGMWVDWFPPAYAFEGGRIHILPRTVELSPTGSMVALAIGGVFAVILGAGYALYVQRGLRSIRRQLHMQAWQLEQVVADHSASSSSPPPSQPLRRK